MATCQTPRWVSTAPYVKLTVTESSSTATTATLSWTLQYISDTAASTSTAKEYSVKINGSVVKSGTYSIHGKTGTNTIASGTKTINKTTSAQTISFSCSMAFNLTWSGTYAGTKSGSGSITVAKKTSYTVSYNANGGTGAPSGQTKWHDTTLTLSSVKPTRTGYTFQGWGTSSSDTSVNYAAGAKYTANAKITLYAIWTVITYTVSYNANGGSGAPSAQTKTYGKSLTLSSVKPTRTGYTFQGWGTTTTDTTVNYNPGGGYTANADEVLYAIWTLNTYKVSYNANGGTGAPSAQTKTYGTALTLSTTKPTRTGYTFQGWGTSASDTTVDFNPGGSYTGNAVITLYAIWTVITYKVTFDANGGTGAPSAVYKKYTEWLTLPSTKPTRTNYTFKGWGTSKSASIVAYEAGGTYQANKAITLYALWKSSYTAPRISNLSVNRTDSGDGGTARFSWTSDKNVSSITIKWKLSTASSYPSGNTISIYPDDISGAVNTPFGSGSLDKDNTYDVQIIVTDSNGSSTKTVVLPGIKYIIDILNTGDGVAFGKPAELADYLDVGYKTRFGQNVRLNRDAVITGTSNTDTSLQLISINSENNNTVIGYGGYYNKIATTNLYGNNVHIISNNGIFANGCRLAENKILWSGTFYMTSGHTAGLSEPISSQANGIVLVWSHYSGGEKEDQYWNHIFIPKQHVISHETNGVSMMLSATPKSFLKIGVKYIYISDSVLTGYAENNQVIESTDSNLKIHNNAYVLRYVIGV